MATAKGDKCAHPACTCTTNSGKYCSAECEAMEKTSDVDCSCGHAICMLSNWGANHTLRASSPVRPRPSH